MRAAGGARGEAEGDDGGGGEEGGGGGLDGGRGANITSTNASAIKLWPLSPGCTKSQCSDEWHVGQSSVVDRFRYLACRSNRPVATCAAACVTSDGTGPLRFERQIASERAYGVVQFLPVAGRKGGGVTAMTRGALGICSKEVSSPAYEFKK